MPTPESVLVAASTLTTGTPEAHILNLSLTVVQNVGCLEARLEDPIVAELELDPLGVELC